MIDYGFCFGFNIYFYMQEYLKLLNESWLSFHFIAYIYFSFTRSLAHPGLPHSYTLIFSPDEDPGWRCGEAGKATAIFHNLLCLSIASWRKKIATMPYAYPHSVLNSKSLDGRVRRFILLEILHFDISHTTWCLEIIIAAASACFWPCLRLEMVRGYFKYGNQSCFGWLNIIK